MQYLSPNLVLVWFSSDFRSAFNNSKMQPINCVFPKNQVIMLKNLLHNTSYTACLLEQQLNTVSPLDCLSFSTVPRKNDEPIWLTVNAKNVTVSLMVVGIIFAIVFGVIMGCLVVRKYPFILHGNKRVIVMKDNTMDLKEVLIMPPEWKDNETKGIYNQLVDDVK